MRDRVGLVDLAAFAIFDVTGPGAPGYLQGLVVNQVDVPVGRVIYTPLLNEAGGIFADLTIMRLAHDRFRVVTGGGMGMRDKKWFVDHLPADGSAQLADADLGALHDRRVGTASPRPRPVGRRRPTCRTRRSRSGPAGPWTSTASARWRRGSRTSASSAGRSTARWSRDSGCGTRSGRRAGRTASRRSGSASTPTTARLEKGYRAHGAELELEFDLVEAGMARPKVKDADFVGRAAYLERRARPPAAVLSTLTVDDPTSSSGVKRYMLGREPILSADGRPLVDAQGPPLVRDERRLGAVGRQAPPDGLPAAGPGGRGQPSCSSSTSASATR